MAYDPKINTAKKNQIIILSALQSGSAPLGFNELKRKTQLHQNTLDKWIAYFTGKGCIEKIGDNKRKKLKITEKGILEFRKLLSEENAEKIYANLNLIDSVRVEKKDFNTEQGTFSCQVVSPVSTILNEEKRQLLEKKINNEILPSILEIYTDLNISSGALTLGFRKKTN